MVNYEKKYQFEEYFINDNYIKKLYNLYIDKHIANKILNFFVLFAIVSTVTAAVLEYLGNADNQIVFFVNSFSTIILFIFMIELIRDYAASKTKKKFFREHWIDFILVMFLTFYFIFMTFFGFLKVFLFDLLKPIFSDTKELRLVFKLFKR